MENARKQKNKLQFICLVTDIIPFNNFSHPFNCNRTHTQPNENILHSNETQTHTHLWIVSCKGQSSFFTFIFSSVTYFIRLHSCCTTICNHKFTGCSSQINLLPFSCQFMRRPTDLLFASRHPVGATGQNYMQGKVLAVMQ